MDFFRVFLKAPIKASSKDSPKASAKASPKASNIENLLCYTISQSQANIIDPSPEHFMNFDPVPITELPEGDYFITQLRKEKLEEAELLELAIVLQQEALWNRNKLQDKLFLRQFFEDGFPVIQLWRPIITANQL